MTQENRHSVLQMGNLLMIQERERALAAILRSRGWLVLEDLRAFEAGSGSGYNLRLLVQWGAKPANLVGMDNDRGRTSYSVSRSPEIRCHTGSAEHVPEPEKTFDLTLAFTLFSSIHDEEVAARIAAEMYRVTKPGGLILIYDLRRNNPRNPAVHAVGLQDIRRWFPKCSLRARSTTLVPPLARQVGRFAPWLYGPLAAVPVLRTHYLVVLQRPGVEPFAEPAGNGKNGSQEL